MATTDLHYLLPAQLQVVVPGQVTTKASDDESAGLALPKFTNPSHSAVPTLPTKWVATAIMAPFIDGQLVLGRFECDRGLDITRIRLFGVERGWLELLLDKHGCYRRATTGEWIAFGPAEWKSFGEDWLGKNATCLGIERLLEGSFLAERVEWWKSPVEGTKAVKWIWYSESGRLPRRTMFAKAIPSLPVLGSFSTTYFLEFRDAPDIELQNVPNKKEVERVEINLLMELDKTLSQTENDGRIATLNAFAPGISLPADAHLPPRWPSQIGMTTFMTPVRADRNPLPTEVWYDDTRRSQRTRMFQPDTSEFVSEDALLLEGVGHLVENFKDPQMKPTCAPVLPGIPWTDWMARDNAKVRAVLTQVPGRGRAATEDAHIYLIMAPMVHPSVFWTWYTKSGRPLVFMETSAPPEVGTGLALADYYDWQPGRVAPPSTYELPSNCVSPAPEMLLAYSQRAPHSVASPTSSESKDGTTKTNGALIDSSCYHCHRKATPGKSSHP